MACFAPLAATQLPGGEIVIHRRTPGVHQHKTPAHLGRDIPLPCGRCIGCKLTRATEWATRCLHESQLHEETCALTLTYSDDPNYTASHQDRDWSRAHQDVCTNQKSAREFSTIAPKGFIEPNIAHVENSRLRPGAVPYGSRTRATPSMALQEGRTLSVRDHQLFMKKLREKIGKPVRFYMCGEYGEKLERPHYHYLIFGYDFPDKKYFKKSLSGTPLFRSAQLEEVWTEGHSWIGQVDYATCAYVASYVMKKMNGKKAEEHYRRTDEAGNDFWIKPEFNLMSRNPGIAKDWWMKFHADVTTTDGVWRGSMKTKPPRYYDKLLEMMDPKKFEAIKAERLTTAEGKKEDNTPARLEAKEIVQIARCNLKQRQMEK